jgi:4-carboxymuconolactone decarboxylase
MADGETTRPAGRTLPLSRSDLPPAAQAAFDRIADDRGEVPWLFRFLLGSPELAHRVSSLGDFLRASSSIPDDMRELVILLLSRRLDFQLEWSYHEDMARDAGVAGDVVAALRDHREPRLSDDQRVVCDLALAIVDHRVSDRDFDAVVDRFGTAFAVDLAVLAAFIVFMQHLVETLDVPLPEGVAARLPIPATPARSAQ